MQTVIPLLVEVTPQAASTTKGPWHVQYGGQGSDKKKSFPIVDLPIKTGPYDITFRIVGSNDVTFDKTDPIWVKAGGPPNKKQSHGQIQSPTLSADAKQLTVHDPNSNDAADKLLLHYRLNFSTASTTHKFLDPIIRNGGTTGPRAAIETAALIIGVVTLLAVAFAIYQQFNIMRILRK